MPKSENEIRRRREERANVHDPLKAIAKTPPTDVVNGGVTINNLLENGVNLSDNVSNLRRSVSLFEFNAKNKAEVQGVVDAAAFAGDLIARNALPEPVYEAAKYNVVRRTIAKARASLTNNQKDGLAKMFGGAQRVAVLEADFLQENPHYAVAPTVAHMWEEINHGATLVGALEGATPIAPLPMIVDMEVARAAFVASVQTTFAQYHGRQPTGAELDAWIAGLYVQTKVDANIGFGRLN